MAYSYYSFLKDGYKWIQGVVGRAKWSQVLSLMLSLLAYGYLLVDSVVLLSKHEFLREVFPPMVLGIACVNAVICVVGIFSILVFILPQLQRSLKFAIFGLFSIGTQVYVIFYLLATSVTVAIVLVKKSEVAFVISICFLLMSITNLYISICHYRETMADKKGKTVLVSSKPNKCAVESILDCDKPIATP
ncbi:hypothetical protein L596_029511 [Steinernema carpocapsae]|uniref:Uncharacterized protein n=1 Tax=Steinernema carpocapsae TaxID=34508 RepID=A0A4U5LUV7_STECR|nr:hypothetical protein L596_029493 [Steinernema carpocapsae]TKR59903.1 hypothetical protein L596_029511 [Steinernema carpocapsae]